ncbi:hypothetical protein Sden_3679 [Shewanella denitrificans OS217]|uniref:Uncharacterized protein n=1 Tax=Shewanella denitrificans (strain OS217 / ATCC BAA-1090 / DSM 15013) TaxID=318161 RepID=Q12HX4_SHEDO|nr:hypothetical protein Sden_3679 [Shewanella denitrificans OS217]
MPAPKSRLTSSLFHRLYPSKWPTREWLGLLLLKITVFQSSNPFKHILIHLFPTILAFSLFSDLSVNPKCIMLLFYHGWPDLLWFYHGWPDLLCGWPDLLWA